MPARAPFLLIAQISDLHITSPGTLAYGRVDITAARARSIDSLNRLSPRPDLVVISGDIANSALPKKYEHAKTLLAYALTALLERHPRALLVASTACPLCPRRPSARASLPPAVPIGEFPGPYCYGYADTAPPRL
ncbi:MAG: hypothetical protein WA322_09855 [Pseudolabrys sp.]